MSDKKSLADQIRERLNANAGKEIAKVYKPGEALIQVDEWIQLKPFFKKGTGGEGFACGHITLLIGEPDSGKTTLLMEGMVACQKAGGVAYLIDSENKYSMERFALMGGDPESVIVLQPTTLEEAWDMIAAVLKDIKEMRENGIDAPMLLGWDSIPASVPGSVVDSESGDSHVAVDAKINNKNIRRLRSLIRETKTAFVAINHFYMTIPKPFQQSKLIVKGGEELSFLALMIIKTEQGAKLTRNVKGEEQKIGRMTRYTIHKGHVSARTINQSVYVVDKGILESKEEFAKYQKSLRGDY